MNSECGRAVGPHANLHAVGGGLRGTESPVGITGVYPRAVGSHSYLHSVGGGLGGVAHQKIETDIRNINNYM